MKKACKHKNPIEFDCYEGGIEHREKKSPALQWCSECGAIRCWDKDVIQIIRSVRHCLKEVDDFLKRFEVKEADRESYLRLDPNFLSTVKVKEYSFILSANVETKNITKCYGPLSHTRRCRPARPLCKWMRLRQSSRRPCYCCIVPWPHRAGWCIKFDGIPLTILNSPSWQKEK